MDYRCDHCGACCRHLIVEIDELDVLREPRLTLADPRTRDREVEEVLEELRDEAKCLIIAGPYKCRFRSQQCEIYPSRPNVCVAMQAGNEQCRMAREMAELAALEPYTESEPQPPSDVESYPWPASRLTARDMEMLTKLREQTKKPITVLLHEAVFALFERR